MSAQRHMANILCMCGHPVPKKILREATTSSMHIVMKTIRSLSLSLSLVVVQYSHKHYDDSTWITPTRGAGTGGTCDSAVLLTIVPATSQCDMLGWGWRVPPKASWTRACVLWRKSLQGIFGDQQLPLFHKNFRNQSHLESPQSAYSWLLSPWCIQVSHAVQ